jgi:hypothetical protein
MEEIGAIIEMLNVMNNTAVIRFERNNKILITLFKLVNKHVNRKTKFYKEIRNLRNQNKKNVIKIGRGKSRMTGIYNAYKEISVDETTLLRRELKNLQGEMDKLRTSKGLREKTAEEIKRNKKAALLIGINYQGTRNELGGCENDIYDMKAKLIVNYGILEEDILVLTEKESKTPTATNIIYGMNWLVEKNKQGYENIWFQYSGHGYFKTDVNGDELDGRDECLVTVDNKLITDDELNTNLINRMSSDVNMICIMDCCHAGTILDLKYKYKTRGVCELQYNNRDGKNIISISGCRDDQTSADAWFSNKWNGALTKKLILVLERSNYTITNMNLLAELHTELGGAGFTQKPVVTTSRRLTDHSPFVI